MDDVTVKHCLISLVLLVETDDLDSVIESLRNMKIQDVKGIRELRVEMD